MLYSLYNMNSNPAGPARGAEAPPSSLKSFLTSICVSVIHASAAILMQTRGGRSLPDLTFSTWSWASDNDLCLGSVICCILFIFSNTIAIFAPICCYRRCRAAAAFSSVYVFTSLFAGFGLAKVTAAPAESPLFWAQAVLLFMGACAEGFLAAGALGAVRARALAAASAAQGLQSADDAAEGLLAAESRARSGGSGENTTEALTSGRASGTASEAEAADSGKSAATSETKKSGAPVVVTAASMWRLMSLSAPDAHYVLMGFLSLVVAAVAGTIIPGLTGSAIDSVGNEAQLKIVLAQLLGASALSAAFTGARGWAFTVAISRLKVRLRDVLLRAILSNETAFFDASSVGELSSRLSSDTTVVGDQVSLNVNVFLRSAIAALGSLLFMFSLSWRLSLLSFCVVPPTIAASAAYGKWVQALSRRRCEVASATCCDQRNH
jgi:hypothetical protein